MAEFLKCFLNLQATVKYDLQRKIQVAPSTIIIQICANWKYRNKSNGLNTNHFHLSSQLLTSWNFAIAYFSSKNLWSYYVFLLVEKEKEQWKTFRGIYFWFHSLDVIIHKSNFATIQFTLNEFFHYFTAVQVRTFQPFVEVSEM